MIINRLDSICQAVLKGKWPGHRRVYEPGSTVASFYTTKLLDNANSLCEDPSASPQGSKVTKHVAENKEFSVKLNDVCLISQFLPPSPSLRFSPNCRTPTSSLPWPLLAAALSMFLCSPACFPLGMISGLHCLAGGEINLITAFPSFPTHSI